MLPSPILPLAEHASLGQNCCDASICSVLVVFMFTASYGRTIFSITPDFLPVRRVIPLPGTAPLTGEIIVTLTVTIV